MATYKQIHDDVKSQHGVYVQGCNIAHVKEFHGLTRGPSKRRKEPGKIQKPCPEHKWKLIEESMRKFGMIP